MDIPENTRNILICWRCVNNLGSQKFKYIFITSPTHNIYTFIVLLFGTELYSRAAVGAKTRTLILSFVQDTISLQLNLGFLV